MSTGFPSVVPECVVESCYEHEGVIVPNFIPLRALRRLRTFASRPDDLYIVTYPKSGTTWAEQLTLLVHFDGDISKFNDGMNITRKVPFLEVVKDFSNTSTSPLRIDEAESMTSPRILKSHCHFPSLPLDIASEDPKAKVLYVARNPKDAAVSYYHFCHYIPGLPSYESWDVFFEEFLAGRGPRGSWFRNVLPWWKIRNHPNVLFLKYEDMKKDLRGAVRQIADFMGKSFTDDVIEKISNASTFKAMKSSTTSNPDFAHNRGPLKEGKSFMRKGIIGDWKNYFTDDQNSRFDELYNQEMASTGLEMDFDGVGLGLS